MRKLYVFHGLVRVGVLNENLTFEYDQDWAKRGFAISPNLSLSDMLHIGDRVGNFFDNLLPEGDGLEELSRIINISKGNKFALLGALGLDTSGALSFSFQEDMSAENNFFDISKEELADRIKRRKEIPIAIWKSRPRVSVAGVQDKLVLTYLDNHLGFGEGDICSTHILKFDKADENLVANEYLSMFLAKKAGLDTANNRIEYFNDEAVLVVERFDRIVEVEHGVVSSVKKIHVIDGCQALSLKTKDKYERNFGDGRDVRHIREGASFSKLHRFSNRCQIPASVNNEIVKWCIVNLCLGNSDAHGKNISFFAQNEHPTLTPFYDIVNIQLYENLYNVKLAMAIGDEFDIDSISAFEIENFCEDMQIKPAFFVKQFSQISKKIVDSINDDLAVEIIDNNICQAFSDIYIADVVGRINRFSLIVETVNITSMPTIQNIKTHDEIEKMSDGERESAVKGLADGDGRELNLK